MNSVWLVIFLVANWLNTPQTFTAQFAKAAVGLNVTVCIDGSTVEQTFAGKLSFKDERHAWQSVCADVHAPITAGQMFGMRPLSSRKTGGNIAKAGNIVAKYFHVAQTPEQCAGLQIAVWKAIEDGDDAVNFSSGNFQVRASAAVLSYAAFYFQAINEPGDAVYLQSDAAGGGQGSGQSQLSTN